MNIIEAATEMEKGERVRLPNWPPDCVCYAGNSPLGYGRIRYCDTQLQIDSEKVFNVDELASTEWEIAP